MQNRSRKRDAKIMNKERTWSPNGSQNPIQIIKNPQKNEVQKSMRKRMPKPAPHGIKPVGPKAT